MAGAIAGKEADSALADGTTSDTLQQKAPAAAAPRRRFRMRIATALMLAFGAVVFVGTDDNIHYCPENCEKPLCITCPSSALEA